jgi:hypothetical protein
MWGDVAPDTITFEMMSRWRAALEKKHGRSVAHKTLRAWRTFWKIMLGMKVARTADPSMGIRNLAPAPRWQRWSEGETVRLVKVAWRNGYRGLVEMPKGSARGIVPTLGSDRDATNQPSQIRMVVMKLTKMVNLHLRWPSF